MKIRNRPLTAAMHLTFLCVCLIAILSGTANAQDNSDTTATPTDSVSAAAETATAVINTETADNNTTTLETSIAEPSSTAPENNTLEPASTEPEVSTAEPSSTAPEVSTAEPSSAAPEVSTAEPSSAAPEGSTAEPSSAAPEVSTAEPSSTAPEVSTAEPSSTAPEGSTTEPSSTAPEGSTAEPSSTAPEGSTAEPSSTAPEGSTAEPSSTAPESSTAAFSSFQPQVSTALVGTSSAGSSSGFSTTVLSSTSGLGGSSSTLAIAISSLSSSTGSITTALTSISNSTSVLSTSMSTSGVSLGLTASATGLASSITSRISSTSQTTLVAPTPSNLCYLCSPFANCTTSSPGQSSCSCITGYAGNGYTCEKINYCSPSPCASGATCTSTLTGAVCSCLPNYQGDGKTCSLTCLPNCVCGSTNYTSCSCFSGYTYNTTTYTCQDVNECLGTNQCSANAACTNTIGSYTCTCNSGYVGNGKNCTPQFLVNVPSNVSTYLRNCADCGMSINLGCYGVPFGSRTYSQLYVNSNGYVTFGNTNYSLNLPIASSFVPMIAPYWANMDLTCGGAISYAVAFQGSALFNSTLQVLQYTSNRNLQPIMAVIITFQDMRPSPSCNYTSETVTFQMILLTDLYTTEFVVYYPISLTPWSSSRYWRRIITGYGNGSGNFTTYWSQVNSLQNIYSFDSSTYYSQPGVLVPYSLSSSLGNTNQLAIWSYTVGSVTTSSFAYCTWLQSAVPVKTPNACPASSSQAALDNRFVLSSNDYLFPYSWTTSSWWITWNTSYANQYRYACYLDAQWSAQTYLNTTQYVKQQCCYQIQSATGVGSLVTIPPYAGTMMTSISSELSYKQQMYLNGDFNSWISVRPISAANYNPPEVALSSGDPHIQTLDGASYTFNGWGEYVLSATNALSSSNFVIQCRTGLAGAQATAFVAFALQLNGGDIIMLSYNLNWNGIDIFVNGVNQTLTYINQNLAALENAPPTAPPYRITVANNAVTVTNLFCSLTVSLGYQSLSTTFNLPVAARGLMQGLLGNFDGNAENDYMFPNGESLPSNSTESQLFPFGQSWVINCSQTLFTYFGNETCESVYSNSQSFSPLFANEITPENMLITLFQNNSELMNAASASCNAFINTPTYQQCMFDAGGTGSVEAASSLVSAVSSFQSAVSALNTFPPSFDMPSSITVYTNSLFSINLIFNATDVTKVAVQPTGSSDSASSSLPTVINSNGVYNLTWQISDQIPLGFEILVLQSNNQSAVWSPTIFYCGCQNNGVCVTSSSSSSESTSSSQANVFIGTCQCPGLYSGTYCQYDPCSGLEPSCYPGVTCSVVNVSFTCGNCPAGYSGDGITCRFNDPCLTAGCSYECLSQPSANYSYTCTCQSGFQPNPAAYTNCIDVNECVLNTSLCTDYANGMCVNTNGSYQCSCTSGYQYLASSSTCIDINECVVGNPCTVSASVGCTNTEGSYECSCNPGYQAVNNVSTSNTSLVCSEILYCSSTPSPCEYVCNDIPGSYICSCPVGYMQSGSGTNITCSPIDFCALNPCGSDTCLSANGTYQCFASATSNGTIATSEPETTISSASVSTTAPFSLPSTCSCPPNANCTEVVQNNYTSYRCTCNAGYYGLAYVTNGSCSQMNPSTSRQYSSSMTFSVSGYSKSVFVYGSPQYLQFISYIEVLLNQIFSNVSTYALGSSHVSSVSEGSVITSFSAVVANSDPNAASSLSSALATGITNPASLQLANQALAGIGVTTPLTAAMISVTAATAVPICQSVVCPSPTVCSALADNTAQCLCPSGYTGISWVNSYTQSCQLATDETNVVAIVLPVVFGVLAVQVALFVIYVLCKRSKQEGKSERFISTA